MGKQPDIQTRNLGWDPGSTEVDYWRWEKLGGGAERKGWTEKEKRNSSMFLIIFLNPFTS